MRTNEAIFTIFMDYLLVKTGYFTVFHEVNILSMLILKNIFIITITRFDTDFRYITLLFYSVIFNNTQTFLSFGLYKIELLRRQFSVIGSNVDSQRAF